MLLDPGAEQRAVDGPVDGKRSDESFHAQRAEEGGGLPTTQGVLFHQSRADRSAAVAARHVRFGPCFVDENDFVGIHSLLRSSPLSTFLGNVGSILFAGD